MVTGRNHSFWWWHGPRTPRPHPSSQECVCKRIPRSLLFVVCSRFFGAQIINISHVRTPSGRDEDHLQRRQRPVSYILMVCLNHYQFFVSEIRFAPISMCWFVFIQFVLWLCWSQGPKTPRTLLFFSARGAAKVAGKPVGLLWCAGIFREPLPLPSLEKNDGRVVSFEEGKNCAYGSF